MKLKKNGLKSGGGDEKIMYKKVKCPDCGKSWVENFEITGKKNDKQPIEQEDDKTISKKYIDTCNEIDDYFDKRGV